MLVLQLYDIILRALRLWISYTCSFYSAVSDSSVAPTFSFEWNEEVLNLTWLDLTWLDTYYYISIRSADMYGTTHRVSGHFHINHKVSGHVLHHSSTLRTRVTSLIESADTCYITHWVCEHVLHHSRSLRTRVTSLIESADTHHSSTSRQVPHLSSVESVDTYYITRVVSGHVSHM